VATTLGGWLNAGLLYATLAKKGYFVTDMRLRRALPRIVLATIIMSVVLCIVADALGTLFSPPTRELTRAVALMLLVGAGLLAYVVAVFATGALDSAQLRRFLTRKTPPPGPL
jgi:putative peptidoglycan lipid II flippase